MASELDHLQQEMVELVGRVERMERERRNETRTPGGVLVPHGAVVKGANLEEIKAQLASFARRLNGMEEILSRNMKVLQRQQGAIEELTIEFDWIRNPGIERAA